MGRARRRCPQRNSSGSLELCFPDEVLTAIDSLYNDELKPYGRILRKRVAEEAVGWKAIDYSPEASTTQNEGRDPLPNVDIERLRKICDDCDKIHVEQERGGDWSAQLKDRSSKFVDVYSSDDFYPPVLWDNMTKYFEKFEGDDKDKLPGGRYACAQVLVARAPPFLAKYKLGEVCHIVQLAISQRKILGYVNGALVPYRFSQSMKKVQHAKENKPLSSSSGEGELATWEHSPGQLKMILESALKEQRSKCLPLSNVKRRFRSRFNVELSETALGYSKLSNLLQDERFKDVCTIKLAGHGYVVQLAGLQSEEARFHGPLQVLGDHGPQKDSEPRHVHVTGTMLSGFASQVKVQNTFLNVPMPPPTPQPGARHRSNSSPAMAFNDPLETPPERYISCPQNVGMCVTPVSSAVQDPTFDSNVSLLSRRPGFSLPLTVDCTESVHTVHRTPKMSPYIFPSAPTPSPGCSCRSRSLPKDASSNKSPLGTACHTPGFTRRAEDLTNEALEPQFVHPVIQTPMWSPQYCGLGSYYRQPHEPFHEPFQLFLIDHLKF